MGIRPLLTGSMMVRRQTGKDKYQQPIFSELGPYPCRADETQRMIRTSDGQEAMSDAQVFTETEVRLTDQIKWGNRSRWSAILNIAIVRKRSGSVSHYEVWTA